MVSSLRKTIIITLYLSFWKAIIREEDKMFLNSCLQKLLPCKNVLGHKP